MKWEHPLIGVAAFLVGLLIAGGMQWKRMQAHRSLKELFSKENSRLLVQKISLQAWRIFWFSWLLALLLFSIALATPVLKTEVSLVQSARISFLVDISASMGVKDGPGGMTRLEEAIHALEKILTALPYAEVSLSLFNQELYKEIPFTKDRVTLMAALNSYAKATFGGSEINTALKEMGDQQDAIVLFTDGEADDKQVSKFSTPLFVVLVGSEKGGEVPELQVISKTHREFLKTLNPEEIARGNQVETLIRKLPKKESPVYSEKSLSAIPLLLLIPTLFFCILWRRKYGY